MRFWSSMRRERTGGFLLYILGAGPAGGLSCLGREGCAVGRGLCCCGQASWGLFITASDQLGPAGILFCMAALLPQAFFYAGYGIILWYFFPARREDGILPRRRAFWHWGAFYGKLLKSDFSEYFSKNNLIFSMFLRII